MTQDVELSCRCGEVHGWVKGVSPSTVNRAICYCDDCQAFAHQLGRADLLDAKGGTEVVQVAPNALSFDKGVERITGLRLSPNGIHRWYASCCNTPLGNTRTPALPFVGILTSTLQGSGPQGSGAQGSGPQGSGQQGSGPQGSGERLDQLLGKVRGGILGQYAIGGPPPGSTKMSWSLIVHTLRLLLGWKLGGKAWPHPFFDRASGAPSRPVVVLSREERDSLRPKCGPNPTSVSAS